MPTLRTVGFANSSAARFVVGELFYSQVPKYSSS